VISSVTLQQRSCNALGDHLERCFDNVPVHQARGPGSGTSACCAGVTLLTLSLNVTSRM
jgi:hypothetical protein